MKIEWHDGGRDPQCASDPAWPDGKDLRLCEGIQPKCVAQLPYPAKRCGMYIIECERCGTRVGVTTAGRPDDPRSVEMMCRQVLN